MKKIGSILWGILFILVGVIWGCNALGITDINLFFSGWWTLLIIVPCAIDILKGEDIKGNLIGLAIGIILLLCKQDILDTELCMKLFLPIVLVIIGMSFIFKDLIGSNFKKEIAKLNKTQKNEGFNAVFGGQDVKFDNQEFTGTNLSAIFGGVECDLRNSLIKSDCVINANSIFGGIDIFVPSYVKVKVKSTPIFGGISNKAQQNVVDDSPTVYVNGLCVFGGIEIK